MYNLFHIYYFCSSLKKEGLGIGSTKTIQNMKTRMKEKRHDIVKSFLVTRHNMRENII